MPKIRVTAFVDGFNLYHAVDDLGHDHLKWLDLRRLSEHFVDLATQDLGAVFYFSAYATWRHDAYARHREYVKALRATGVTLVLGKFKRRSRRCHRCGAEWEDHEEKETDVNIGLHMLNEARKDTYDRGILISGDSDLAPAVRMVRQEFPGKVLVVVAPPGRRHSKDLTNAAGGRGSARKVQAVHLERSLLSEIVRDASGANRAARPAKYRPPEDA